MSVTLVKNGSQPFVINTQEQLEYKMIWCRLENGGYWSYRSRPAQVAERLVREYNEVVPPGRSYHAFPMGFDANVLGPDHFSLVVVQSIEDHLLHPDDDVYRRMKEQVAELATNCHGMTKEQVDAIILEFTSAFNRSKGAGYDGTGD
ncbi:hypothetical protein [Paenibacillus gansuensis]|uniref:Uncharacterized protein n=1 Tax=Paenibacillus gansuensis TaxID=306542 RepID=A0ABW5PIJ1_9BACL